MLDADDDAALAGRIAREDRDAEAALCTRWWPRVRAYGRLHLRDEDEALDLAQHVLVVVIDALRERRVEDVARLAAFVSGTCRNTLSDWRRGQKRRRALLERFGPSFADVVQPRTPAGRGLEDCLGGLAERERSVLVLTYYAELTAEEIADEQQTTAGNVRVVRHRALGKLRTCLEVAS
jgi:RNA polymerase sigma-70 factor (ECF subfamily)